MAKKTCLSCRHLVRQADGALVCKIKEQMVHLCKGACKEHKKSS